MNYVLPSPSKIHVIGTSCSGKSTFARKLSETLNIAYVELDALHWEANWQECEASIFQARVAEAIKPESWIVDGSYGRKIGDTVSGERNYVIWIDIPLPLILIRFFKRSLKRSWQKEILWGGCQETLRNSIFQKNSLLIWILKHHSSSRSKYLLLLKDPPHGVSVIRLQSAKEINTFLGFAQSKGLSSRPSSDFLGFFGL